MCTNIHPFLIFIFFGISFVFAGCENKSTKKEAPQSKDESGFCSYCVDDLFFEPISDRYASEKRLKIEKYIKTVMDTENFSGSFLVAKNGQIIYESYHGYSDLVNRKKMDASTPLHLASVGKVMTATAIFRMIEAKKIQLDDKVKSILPLFPYDDISVRMLLNHRSGLPNYAYYTANDSVWNKEIALTNQDVLRILGEQKVELSFPAGSKFAYSNTNFALLALIIEKIENKSFSLAMKDLVFDPAGMKNTFVFDLAKDSNRVSQSYFSTFKEYPFDYLDAIYGDKNIYSTPQDLLEFDKTVYNPKFISDKLRKEIFKGYSYERPGIKNYGLGIRMKEWETGDPIFYHNGWWHGNTSCFVSLKREKVTIIALSNKFTRKVYDVIRLSSLFGDYPFDLNLKSLKQVNDSSPD